MIKTHLLILLLILIFGLGIRIYNLSSIPISLASDEVALGYNAYSILKTGKDEHGYTLPFLIKSFGDYKMPFYVYTLVPFIFGLGLSDFSIRFPVALSGTLMIFLTFLISKKLFNSLPAALTSALLIAVSSWAIIFSRGAWEGMFGAFLTTLGVYFFLLGKDKNRYSVLGLIVFIFAFYTYHAQRVVVPLLAFTLYFCFKQTIGLNIRKGLLFSVIFLLSTFPIIYSSTTYSGQSRALNSLVTDYFYFSTKDQIYDQTYLVNESSGLNSVTHSRLILTLVDISSKLFAYLSPAGVFVYGDEVGRHKSVESGVLYSFEFIFLLSGVYFLIKQRSSNQKKFLIFWIIIGLLPAMITKDYLHSVRSLSALVPIYILEGWGAFKMYQTIKKINYKVAFCSILLFIIVLGLSFMRFVHGFFVFTPIEASEWWQYGYKPMIEVVKSHQDRFSQVIVDVPKMYGTPYIYFLFYTQYDPIKYNQTVNRKDDFAHKAVPVFGFDKYQFRSIYWPVDRSKTQTLFVGTEESLPLNDISDNTKYKLLDEIKAPNGKVVFRIVETL